MFKNITKFLTKLFKPRDYSTDVEQYILSKNPKTPQDIDYWQRKFDQNAAQHGLFRGDYKWKKS